MCILILHKNKDKAMTTYERLKSIIRSQPGHFDNALENKNATSKVANAGIRIGIGNVTNKLGHRNPPEIIVIEQGRGSRSGVHKLK
jgi:hypothetical protein